MQPGRSPFTSPAAADSCLSPASCSPGPSATDGGQQGSSGAPASPSDSSSSNSTGSSGPSSTDACVTNPSSSSCTDYKYSDEQAIKDLEVICASQPHLSACSLFKLCTTGVDPMSIGKTPRTCNDFHLLATACKHDSIGKNETVRGTAVVTLCKNSTALELLAYCDSFSCTCAVSYTALLNSLASAAARWRSPCQMSTCCLAMQQHRSCTRKLQTAAKS